MSSRKSLVSLSVGAFRQDLTLSFATLAWLLMVLAYGISQSRGGAFDGFSANLVGLLIVIGALQPGLKHLPSQRERRFWRLLQGAAWVWCLSLSFILLFPGYSEIPSLLLIDLLYLSFYFFYLAAVESRPDQKDVPQTERQRVRRRFEVIGAIYFIVGLSFYFVVIPIFAAKEEYVSYFPSGFLYVALDLLLVVRLFYAYRDTVSRRWQGIYLGLLISHSLIALMDLLEALSNFPDETIALWWQAPVLLDALCFAGQLLWIWTGRIRHLLQDGTEEAPSLSWKEKRLAFPFSNILLLFAALLPALHLIYEFLGAVSASTVKARSLLLLLYVFVFAEWIRRQMSYKEERSQVLEARRQVAEIALRKAVQEAEAANEAKSLFLANMSHEIRTPMNGIIGTIEMMRATSLSKRQGHFIEIMGVSADALLAVIDDILDLSKIESGMMELAPRPFDVRIWVQETVDLLTPSATQKGLELVCEFEEPFLAELKSDPGALRQILLNLLSNAIKFTSEGTIRVKAISRHLPGAQREMHFMVEDQGIGIPEDKFPLLFKPFSQVDASFTRKYGGTGLGLTISKRLCEMMEGRIWVESQVGVGTTFHFTIRGEAATLEARKAPEEKEESDVSSIDNTAPTVGQRRVLLAEDDEVNQLVLLAMLELLGYQVDLKEDGEATLDALTEQSYHAVLMDIQMPLLDGLEVTRRLRSQVATMNQPYIIAITAHSLRGDAERCLEAGMDAYISKPVHLEELREALEKAPDLTPT